MRILRVLAVRALRRVPAGSGFSAGSGGSGGCGGGSSDVTCSTYSVTCHAERRQGSAGCCTPMSKRCRVGRKPPPAQRQPASRRSGGRWRRPVGRPQLVALAPERVGDPGRVLWVGRAWGGL